MFDSSKFETKESPKRVSQFITYGPQVLKINEITVRTAASGSKQLEFKVEGEEIKDFSGVNGAKGQVGTIRTMYFKDDKLDQLTKFIADIANTLNVKSKLDEIKAESLEEYVEKVTPVLAGKFARYIVTGEEYDVNKFRLGFATYVGRNKETKVKDEYKTLKVERANGTYFTFDANNTYDLKRKAPSEVEPTSDNLPF